MCWKEWYKDFPYGLIIGAVFVMENGTVISLAAGRGIKQAPELTWASFISPTVAPTSRKEGSGDVGWYAAIHTSNTELKAAAITNATLEDVCAAKPSGEQKEPEEMVEPATQPSVGSVV